MVLQLCGRVCRCLFLWNPSSLMKGSFFYGSSVFGLKPSVRCLFFIKPYSFIWIGFFVYVVISELKFAYLTATGSPPFNFKCRGSPLPIPNREVKPDCVPKHREYCSYVGEYVHRQFGCSPRFVDFLETFFIYLYVFFNIRLSFLNVQY